MRIAALRQRDGTTCGPAVAVMARVLLGPAGHPPPNQAWFTREQARVHARVNVVWPRGLGTTPAGVARAITADGSEHGLRYRWRPVWGWRDRLTDVRAAVGSGRPVALLVGRFIPRHWVLLVEMSGERVRCYEPSSGSVLTLELEAVRGARMTGVGYPRAFAVVLPRLSTRSATA